MLIGGHTKPPRDAWIKEVELARNRATDWLTSNLQEDGFFVYSVNVRTGEQSTNDNTIRQLMASLALAKISKEIKQLQGLHQKNLNSIFRSWYQEEGDKAYVLRLGESKLGANAMLLRVLAASPFFQNYTKEAASLANGLLHLQQADGSLLPWYKEPEYKYDADYLLTFYSGEAILALVEYYEATTDDRWLAAAEKSAEYYIRKYITHLDENYYPAYVPWHTIAYNKLYKITGSSKYAQSIFIMNDKLLELLDTKNYVGRFFNPFTPQYGTPHSSSDGVYTDGLAYAYEVARLTNDTEHATRYRDALKIAAANLIGLQYQNLLENSQIKPRQYLGAIATKHGSSWIRVDTTQHALDAFMKIVQVF